MEEKKIIKNIVFSIIAIILLAIVVAGSTYAYFRAGGETAVQTVTTADLGINFVEGELLNAKLIPIEGRDILTKAAKKTFTITNTGEEKLFVHISMEDIVLPEALKRFDFMWSLYEGDTNVSNGTFQDTTGTSIEIGSYQVFEKGATKTYDLYVWIEETSLDQTAMMGQTFKTTIKAVGETYQTSPERCFTFDESIGTITDYAQSCGTDVIIPETIGGVSVTSIGKSAFSDINRYGDSIGKNLTSLVIPNGVTSIGNSAFAYNKLTSLVIPNSVTEIPDSICEGCQLTNLVIPDSVTKIGDSAFVACQLTNLVIPDSVTYIGYKAFINNKLTSVIIPNSVTEIGDSAFWSMHKTLNLIVIKKPSAEGITLGESWYGSCPTENIIYASNY